MITSWLLKCSGANPDILEKCPKHEATIQAGIGGIILGTAALAFISGGYALYTIFKNPWTACGFGFLWALFIFSIDRYFIATINKTFKIRSGFPRLVMAVLIGLTISEPLKLELFRSEIEEVLDAKLKDKKAKVSADYVRQSAFLNDARKANDKERENRREAADRLCKNSQTPLYEKMALLEKEMADKDRVKQSRYDLYLGECSGRAGTRIRGDGPECKRTRKAYEAALEEWRKALPATDVKITGLRKEIVVLGTTRLAEQAKADSEWQGKNNRIDEKEAAISQRRNEALQQLEHISSDGFLSRHIALNDLADHHPVVFGITIMVSLLFISMEAAPVLSKMMLAETSYDYVQKRMDEEVMLEQEAISKVNRTVMGKEFMEHQRSKRVHDMEYDDIRSKSERFRIFSADIIGEKKWFEGKMASLFLHLKRIRDEKVKQKEKGSVEALLDAFYKMENLSYAKFRNMSHELG